VRPEKRFFKIAIAAPKLDELRKFAVRQSYKKRGELKTI